MGVMAPLLCRGRGGGGPMGWCPPLPAESWEDPVAAVPAARRPSAGGA